MFFFLTSNPLEAAGSNRFLTIPPDSRGTALGETGVSYNGGGAGMWWNPANLCGATDLWLEGWSWLGEGRGSFGGARVGAQWGGVGAYYINLGLPGFEVRDRPGDSPGEFTLHQAVFAAGGGWNALPFLQTGAMVKVQIEDIYGTHYQSPAFFDVGLKSNYEVWEAGLAIRNWTLKGQTDNPSIIQVGLSRRLYFSDLTLLNVGEVSYERDIGYHLHLGAECFWLKRIALRSGWSSGRDSRNWTFGLGVVAGRWRVDLAWLPFRHKLGDSWRMGLSSGF